MGVKAFIRNKAGKYLFIKRGAVYQSFAGEWTIPGGRITIGEPLRDALAREIREETGLTLTGEPELLTAQDIIRPPKLHVVRLTYLASVEGEITLDTAEHTELQWMTLSELKKENYDSLFLPVIKLLESRTTHKREK